MKILIIGGTGLISTAITRQLLARGDEVTLYNRGQREVRISEGAQFIYGDRNDFPVFEQQMAEAGTFDCVIEMICFGPEQAESAVRAFKGRTGHFIFCSTVDVYSKPAHRYPLTEDEPRKGNNAYGSNKILCENIFIEAHARGDFPATIIRPAMTYGEGGKLVELTGWGTKYIDRIRKGKPIIVHGDGSALWVACHIDDAARAFVTAAGKPATFGRAYHVTGEEWLTWNKYYEGIAQALNMPNPQLIHIPTDLLAQIAPGKLAVLVDNFQGNNIFDNTAAHTDLDFRYTIPWVEGARRTIEWLDAHRQIIDSGDDPFDDRVIAAWQHLSSTVVQELRDLSP